MITRLKTHSVHHSGKREYCQECGIESYSIKGYGFVYPEFSFIICDDCLQKAKTNTVYKSDNNLQHTKE